MNPSRILFVANDPLFATCYGEALAKAGFHVNVALDGESALPRIQEGQVDLVVIDLLLPGIQSSQVIAAIRENKSTRSLPIIALPTELEPLAQAAHEAGVTKRLERFANPVATLINAVESFKEGSPAVARTEPAQASKEWLKQCAVELPTRIVRLRRALQNTRQQTGQSGLFGELLQEVHQLCELSILIGRKPIFQLASALESLVFDLDTLPQQATLSTVRTVGQAIDLLDTLLGGDRWTRLKILNESQILVVDDDANARQLITAAMQLVTLSATSAATPEATLSIVKRAPFDLIFLDIGLPGMNGFELCTKIRALPAHRDTPIVFLTGMATFQNRVQSSLSGGNDFIGKPFNIPELGVKALLWAFKGQLASV
ncbi:MAG: two-component system response regulator [Chthoniobacteraceae bacterium]|nr:two-component system response regulator [Chthoniobacteraceae bacterium]